MITLQVEGLVFAGSILEAIQLLWSDDSKRVELEGCGEALIFPGYKSVVAILNIFLNLVRWNFPREYLSTLDCWTAKLFWH